MNRVPPDVVRWARKLAELDDPQELNSLYRSMRHVAEHPAESDTHKLHAGAYSYAVKAKIEGRDPLDALEKLARALPDGAVIR